jgi:hypothetical protein
MPDWKPEIFCPLHSDRKDLKVKTYNGKTVSKVCIKIPLLCCPCLRKAGINPILSRVTI